MNEEFKENQDFIESSYQEINHSSSYEDVFISLPIEDQQQPKAQVPAIIIEKEEEKGDSDDEGTKAKIAKNRKANRIAKAQKKQKDILQENLKFKCFESLSGALVKNKPISTDLQLYYGKRVLSTKFREQFTKNEQIKLLSKATKCQVVHLMQHASEVNLRDPLSITQFLQQKGCNFKDAYSLQQIGEGGQCVVYRADLKQPIEAVIKSVLQNSKCQSSLINLLEETALINWLENKEFVVDVKEEILEFDQKSNEILNYLVVTEQALLDLKQIVNIWTNPQKSLEQREHYSDAKLFYFAFKTAEALEYLHSHHIYYGDLKEQNILIFRDYSVKFGDFGISLKLNAGGSGEDLGYDLKGTTQEYCLKEVNELFGENQDAKFPILTLIRNDYWALFYTMNKVAKGVQYQEGYKKDSFFTQFLSDLQSLHPVSKPLKDVITKWAKTLKQTPSFIFELCSQLNSSEKYSAIPNILKLSFSHNFPSYIQKYFEQEKATEMPFLKPKQPSEIEEDREEEEQNHYQDTSLLKINIHHLDREPMIQLLKWQIDQWKVKKEDVFMFIEYLVKFKSHMSPCDSNQFYRELFQEYYQKCSGQNIDYLSMLEAQPFEVLKAFLTLNQNLPTYEYHFRYFLSLFLFHWQTSNPDLKLVNNLLGKLIFYQNQKEDSKVRDLVTKYLNVVYELYLLHIKCHLEDGSKFKYGIKIFDKFSKVGPVLEKLQSRVLGLCDEEEGETDVIDNRETQKAKQHSIVVEYFLKVYKNLYPDRLEKQLTRLKQARQHLKLVYGELGDQMSLNAFQIYTLHMKLQKGNHPFSPQEENEAFNLLEKACSYSSKEFKLEYLYDLMKEMYQNNMYSRIVNIWNEVFQEDQFIFWLLRKHFNGEMLMDSDATPTILTKFFNQETQQQLRKNLNQSPNFAAMIVQMFGIDVELANYEADHIAMEIKLEMIIKRARLIQKLYNWQSQLSESYGYYSFEFNTLGSKQQLILYFKNVRTTTLWLSQFTRDGELIHSGSGYQTQLRYVKGQIFGPCRIVTPVFRLWGNCCNHSFNLVYISFINRDFYQGECKYWKKNGEGISTRSFFLQTTLTQKGIWNNGVLVDSQSSITMPGDFLSLVINQVKALLFLIDQTYLTRELKKDLSTECGILIEQIQNQKSEDIYPLFLTFYRLVVSLSSLQNIFYDLVKVSNNFGFKERVLQSRRISADLKKCLPFIDKLSRQLSPKSTHLSNETNMSQIKESLDSLYDKFLEITSSDKLNFYDVQSIFELAPDVNQGVVLDMLFSQIGQSSFYQYFKPIRQIYRTYEKDELVMKEQKSEHYQKVVLEIVEEIARFMGLMNSIQNERAKEFILSFFFLRKDVNELPQKEVIDYLRVYLLGMVGKSFEIEQDRDQRYWFQGKELTGLGKMVETRQIQRFFEEFISPLDLSQVSASQKFESWDFSKAVQVEILEHETEFNEKLEEVKELEEQEIQQKPRRMLADSKGVEEIQFQSKLDGFRLSAENFKQIEHSGLQLNYFQMKKIRQTQQNFNQMRLGESPKNEKRF